MSNIFGCGCKIGFGHSGLTLKNHYNRGKRAFLLYYTLFHLLCTFDKLSSSRKKAFRVKLGILRTYFGAFQNFQSFLSSKCWKAQRASNHNNTHFTWVLLWLQYPFHKCVYLLCKTNTHICCAQQTCVLTIMVGLFLAALAYKKTNRYSGTVLAVLARSPNSLAVLAVYSHSIV